LKSLNSEKKANYFSEQYILVNTIFAGVILLIMGYSIIFSPDANNYPVVCIHEKLTGLPCPSCGLSHSFSYIVRGQIDEALVWNSYGIRIFIFFFAQLLMRVVFSINYVKYPSIRISLITFDIVGSIILLLISFFPFIQLLGMGIFN
jgi:hypothetical protein